jgi:hypothetical protein
LIYTELSGRKVLLEKKDKRYRSFRKTRMRTINSLSSCRKL